MRSFTISVDSTSPDAYFGAEGATVLYHRITGNLPPLEFVDKFVESLQIYKKGAAGENFGKL